MPRPKVEVFELVANESDTNDQNVHDTFECECERMVQGYADMITSYYGGERGCAEGSEWERYARVLLDLYAGKSHATDKNPYDEEDF